MKKYKFNTGNKIKIVLIFGGYFLIFAFLTLFFYFKFWRSYFIQDEWYYFGLFNNFIDNPFGFIDVAIQQFTQPKLYGIHFTPLYNSIYFLEYQIFGLKFQLYALLSMFLHALTATAVSYLSFKLIKSFIFSFISGLYFVIAYSHIEAVLWANTHLQTQIPTLLVIISLVIWNMGLKDNNKHKLVYAILLLVTGLLIKETVFGVFAVLILMIFLYGKKQIKITGIKLVLVSLLLYLPFRLVFPLIVRRSDNSYEMASVIPSGMFDITPQLLRLFFYPIKAFIQQFIHPDTVISMAKNLAVWNYPRLYGADEKELGLTYLNFINSAGADMIMLSLIMPIFILVMLFVRYFLINGKKEQLGILVLSLSFFVAAVIPLLAVVPWMLTLFTYVTFIESRHFYLISIGAGIFISLILSESYMASLQIKKIGNRNMLIILIFTLFSLFILREAYFSKINIQKNIALGEKRRIITDYIKAVHPHIADRAVFYITSNAQYFGFKTPLVPFQTNFGYTLLNLYFREKHYDDRFFTSGFLIDKGIDAEGYMEINGKGLGYFTKGKTLLSALSEYEIPVENIYAFHYDGANNIISMRTNDIREQIIKEKTLQSDINDEILFKNEPDELSIITGSGVTVLRQNTGRNLQLDIRENGRLSYVVILHKDKPAINMEKFLKQRKITQFSDKEFYFGLLERRTVYYKVINGTFYYFFHNPANYQLIEVQRRYADSMPIEEFFKRLRFD